MIPIYRTEKTIQHHECGADAALKLKDMLDYLQDVAGHHADELGVGLNSFGDTMRMNWVLDSTASNTRCCGYCPACAWRWMMN